VRKKATPKNLHKNRYKLITELTHAETKGKWARVQKLKRDKKECKPDSWQRESQAALTLFITDVGFCFRWPFHLQPNGKTLNKNLEKRRNKEILPRS